MYVAATRAKDRLIMCYPGQECLPPWQMADMDFRTGLCSFIRHLPEGVIEHKSSKPPKAISRPVWQTRSSNFKRKKENLFSSTVERDGLRPGDRVKHPAFGKGVISRFVDSNKVEVLFRDVGRKLLHLEHTTLEKM
jgi:DNA helicase-2/ATP-dependent DNA helicase PcrA